MVMPLRGLYLILSSMLGNTPDVMLYFGVYHQDNVKSETQQKRGTGVRKKAYYIKPPKSWNNFLSYDSCDASKGF